MNRVPSVCSVALKGVERPGNWSWSRTNCAGGQRERLLRNNKRYSSTQKKLIHLWAPAVSSFVLGVKQGPIKIWQMNKKTQAIRMGKEVSCWRPGGWAGKSEMTPLSRVVSLRWPTISACPGLQVFLGDLMSITYVNLSLISSFWRVVGGKSVSFK